MLQDISSPPHRTLLHLNTDTWKHYILFFNRLQKRITNSNLHLYLFLFCPIEVLSLLVPLIIFSWKIVRSFQKFNKSVQICWVFLKFWTADPNCAPNILNAPAGVKIGILEFAGSQIMSFSLNFKKSIWRTHYRQLNILTFTDWD